MRKELIWLQLDVKFKYIRNVTVPLTGWIKTIRKALNMSCKQLGVRCSLSKQRIAQIEQDEVQNKITLETLSKIAKGLECELIYALVPKDKIKNIIKQQAKKKATIIFKNTSHTMQLENQSINKESARKQFDLLVKELIEHNIKTIWD